MAGFFSAGSLSAGLLAAGVGGVASGASSGLMGLFGGGGGKYKNLPEGLDIKQQQDDIAGGAGQKSSVPMTEPINTTLKRQMTDIGLRTASKMAETAGGMFVKDQVGKLLNKPKSAARLGMEQRAFNQQAYPGTNPWEQLGGSGQGAPQQIEQQKTSTRGRQADASESAAQSGRNAQTMAEAPLKKVNIEYQKLSPEIDQLKSSANVKNAQAANIQEGTKEYKALNKSLDKLEVLMKVKRDTEIKTEYNKGKHQEQIGDIKKQPDGSHRSGVQLMADNEIKNNLQQALQASIATNQAKNNEQISKAQAKVSTALTKGDRADWLAAGMVLFGAMQGLRNAAGGIAAIKNFRAPKTSTHNRYGPKTGKDWRQWRMDTGRINKQTGELYP